MRIMFSQLRRNCFFISSIVFLMFLTSCSSTRPEGKTEAEILYKEAMELKNDKRYLMALEKLNTIKSQHPYSFFATPAELAQADILFEQENYVEAAAAYILYKDFHPKHETIEYVINQIGESFFRQLPDDIDRDLSAAHEAMKYFSELLEKFSNGKHSANAREKILDCKRRLELKEKYVADFYYKTEDYQSSSYRYKFILNHVQDENILSHATVRLLLSYLKSHEYKSCLEQATSYGSFVKKNEKSKFDSTVNECRTKLQ